MIENLGKTHLFFTVSSLKTTRKTSAGPGYQFLFLGEIFALGDKRKGAAPILHRIFFFWEKWRKVTIFRGQKKNIKLSSPDLDNRF